MGRDSGVPRAPGRQTKPAYSDVRRTWYGYGHLARAEKSGVGRFLHDCSYVFGDVSVLSLPVLFAIAADPGMGAFDATAAGLLAWATMVVVGAVIRGGWIRPPGTDTRGWVAVTPALIALRLVYYNLTLAVGVFGGVTLAEWVGIPPLSLVTAVAVALATTLAFPQLAESICRTLERR